MTLVRKNLVVKLDGKFYKFANLSINTEKIEFFYQFPWGSKIPAESIIGEKLEKTHLPDHISFHKDGRVHYKFKDSSKKKKYYIDQELHENPFDLKENEAHVILIETVREVKSRLQEVKKPEDGDFVFDLGSNKQFSFFVCSLCEKFNPWNLVTGQWSNIRIIDSALLWEAFTSEDKKANIDFPSSDFTTYISLMFVENLLPKVQRVFDEVTGEEGIEQISITLTPPPEKILEVFK